MPVSAFGLRKGVGGAVKWRSRCRDCDAADQRIARKRASGDRSRQNKDSIGTLRSYSKKLGIPWTEVVERYPNDDRCEICGRTQEEATPSGRFKRLSLDHCHDSGVLRGFLCGPCNSGLGAFGDDPERVEAAARYLRRDR
jgi:hypothetical protein